MPQNSVLSPAFGWSSKYWTGFQAISEYRSGIQIGDHCYHFCVCTFEFLFWGAVSRVLFYNKILKSEIPAPSHTLVCFTPKDESIQNAKKSKKIVRLTLIDVFSVELICSKNWIFC